jgi:hypothetical protein
MLAVTVPDNRAEDAQEWRIIAVDQVMDDAGMVRLLRQDTVQDCRRLFLIADGVPYRNPYRTLRVRPDLDLTSLQATFLIR